MPASYVIEKERRLVITTGKDRVTFAEANTHRDQLLNDPDFKSEFDQLVDLTAVTALDISAQEARAMGTRGLFSSTSRRAIVAPTPAIFGMGRMMQAYNELSDLATQIRVFHDLGSALKWLDLHRQVTG